MMASPCVVQSPRRPRRGSAMILVLIAVGIAFVMGLTFLASATTTTGISQTMAHHAQARQIAESGLATAVRYVQQTSNWRDVRSSGTWIDNVALLGGTVSINGEFPSAAGVPVTDQSFEQTTGQMDVPPLSPPMSGTIGGWQVQRTATIVTGPTVPQLSIAASASAPNGSNAATISFGASVNGSGTFGQTLTTALQSRTIYEVSVDIKSSGLSILDGGFGFRILAGNIVVASTEHAATLVLPILPGQPPTPPVQQPVPPETESVLEIAGLNGDFAEYTLQFATDTAPPSGSMRIELFAQSAAGLAWSVTFDDVQLQMYPQDPLVLTSVGRFYGASYRVSAAVAAATNRVVKWSDL